MIPKDRILDKLDSLLRSNDYPAAKRLLKYWLSEADFSKDASGVLLMLNELMGLCRKLGEKTEALEYAQKALEQVEKMGIDKNVGAATTYLNSATVYKAFGLSEESILLFERAKEIYENELSPTDDRLAGLYNNMGLTLVDLKQFERAYELYKKAISILEANPLKEPEQAITYLNMASGVEAEQGLDEGRNKIDELSQKAMDLLESGKARTDGNYAFVCEKCATVFGYYGYEAYAKELTERYRRIYEGT